MAHRPGDAEITINGEAMKLRLTLGALAQIEDALGGDFDALQARLKSPRISDVILILHALLTGGGAGLSLQLLKASDVDLAQAARAIAAAFQALGDDAEAPGKRQARPSASSAEA
ncbi:MAG: gene transfer agent family protein [Alphaproteobacteria bacterium]|nr:gene transfer agent family protein [Alphaproteobacteria bacterium]